MRKLLGILIAVLAVPALVVNTRARSGDDDRDKPSSIGHEDKVLEQIDHIVVIYQENWSFDSLFGFFPGANGTANGEDGSGNLLFPQVDKSGLVKIVTLPPVKGPTGALDPRFPTNLPPKPYNSVPFLIMDGGAAAPSGLTGDMIHRFYTEQQQIDGGHNDK